MPRDASSLRQVFQCAAHSARSSGKSRVECYIAIGRNFPLWNQGDYLPDAVVDISILFHN